MVETGAPAPADTSAFGSRINGANAALLGVQVRRSLDAGLSAELPDDMMQLIRSIATNRKSAD